MTYQASFTTEGTYIADSLLGGNSALLVSKQVTLQDGPALARGSVLGQITATGFYCLSEQTATDGSENPLVILGEDIPESATGRSALVYTRGDFVDLGLVIGTGHTADSIADQLRMRQIFIVPAVA